MNGRIKTGLLIAGVVLLGVDLFHYKHSHFEYEELFGFYALFGLVAGLVLTLVAHVLRGVVQRGEDYYRNE